MLRPMRKLQILVAGSVLLLLAAAVGCRGFFVDPTLTTVTVGPATPAVEQGATLQMVATGTFDDGSTKTLTANVLWSTSDISIATISNSGLLTGVSCGDATITATSGTLSGSTSATIQAANITRIDISPTDTSVPVGSSLTFSAVGTVQGGGTQVITDCAVWTSSNTAVATIDNTGLVSTLTTGTTQITATSGNIVSNVVTLTVN